MEEIRKELNDLVGLAPVKEYVFGLADNIQVQQRRAAAGLKTASLSMHMIFTGNPGTGKTTIARLVAKYLKAIGALKGGQAGGGEPGGLVGRYTGHTAPRPTASSRARWAASFFIDEAYSLYRGEQDSFGLEAIDTLVKGMEDHRDEPGGHPCGLHQRDGDVPDRQQRPCQPLPEQDRVPGLHRR